MRGQVAREELIAYLECQCSRQAPIFWNNELVLCGEALRRARMLIGNERITFWGYHIFVKDPLGLVSLDDAPCDVTETSSPSETTVDASILREECGDSWHS